MEIVIKNSEIRIKGKSGVLTTTLASDDFVIQSSNGESEKKLTGPGEYEVAGISVLGIQDGDKTAFVYEVDGLRICNLSFFDDKVTENKLNQIGDVDVLLLPVKSKSLEITQQIEPYFIVPLLASGSNEDLDKFLKESGLLVEKMNKFTLKSEEIIEESPAQIILLDA